MPTGIAIGVGIPFTNAQSAGNVPIIFNYIQQDNSDFVQQDGVSVFLIQP